MNIDFDDIDWEETNKENVIFLFKVAGISGFYAGIFLNSKNTSDIFIYGEGFYSKKVIYNIRPSENSIQKLLNNEQIIHNGSNHKLTFNEFKKMVGEDYKIHIIGYDISYEDVMKKFYNYINDDINYDKLSHEYFKKGLNK